MQIVDLKNKNKMKRLVPILLMLGIFSVSHAQDPQFSQFYANALYLNPAFAGSAGGPRVALNSRYQWPSATGGDFQTYSASYDQHFDGIGGGIGAQVMYDKAGEGQLATTTAMLAYSYYLKVNDVLSVKAGMQVGIFQRSLDPSALRFPDQIHPRLGFIYPTQENLQTTSIGPIPDFAAGAVAYTDRYYGGFAVHHITQPNQSFLGTVDSHLKRKITLHAGMMIPLDKGTRNPTTFISPNILYQRQGNFTQVTFGGYFIKEHFIVGALYRQTDPNSDAVIALIGITKDAFRIGYSYDIAVSPVSAAARGSHEVSLIMNVPYTKHAKPRKWKAISCPNL
ncbi:type IX secretion system membrane protein PorP/SprF [bacterium]|nr:type IX secretion system membrane protein PorP/SprF [bacterium]